VGEGHETARGVGNNFNPQVKCILDGYDRFRVDARKGTNSSLNTRRSTLHWGVASRPAVGYSILSATVGKERYIGTRLFLLRVREAIGVG